MNSSTNSDKKNKFPFGFAAEDAEIKRQSSN